MEIKSLDNADKAIVRVRDALGKNMDRIDDLNYVAATAHRLFDNQGKKDRDHGTVSTYNAAIRNEAWELRQEVDRLKRENERVTTRAQLAEYDLEEVKREHVKVRREIEEVVEILSTMIRDVAPR